MNFSSSTTSDAASPLSSSTRWFLSVWNISLYFENIKFNDLSLPRIRFECVFHTDIGIHRIYYHSMAFLLFISFRCRFDFICSLAFRSRSEANKAFDISGYFFGLVLTGNVDAAQILLGEENPLWLVLVACALVGPLYTLYKVLQWSMKDWANHPIVDGLAVYCNNNTTWLAVASDINIEYRRWFFFSVFNTIYSRIYVYHNSIQNYHPCILYLRNSFAALFSTWSLHEMLSVLLPWNLLITLFYWIALLHCTSSVFCNLRCPLS